MKKLLLFLYGSFTALNGFAQNNAGFHHEITQKLIDDAGFELVRKSGTGVNATSVVMTFPDKAVVKAVVISDKGTLVLDLWRINDSDADLTKQPIPADLLGKVEPVSAAEPTVAYKVDAFGTVKDPASTTLNAWTPLSGATIVLDEKRTVVGNPTRVIRIPFKAKTWGISTTPFRYRFATDSSSSTLSSNLSVSASYGYTFGSTLFTSRLTRHNANTVALFFGLSSADIKTATVSAPWLWKKEKRTDRTNAAMSYGISYTRSVNNVGLVVSVGLDTALGPLSSMWSYQNKPWIGLGLSTGLGFFK
jgi:hypothetical protein